MKLTEKEWLGLTYYLEIAYSDFDQSSYPKMYDKQKKEIERLQKKVDQLYFSKENKARKKVADHG